jgi:hypothetical protein
LTSLPEERVFRDGAMRVEMEHHRRELLASRADALGWS